MKIFRRLIKRVKEKKGSTSIEALIAMFALLMVTFLGIAYFIYLVPRQTLTQEVHVLAQTAKIQGGLTNAMSEPGNSDVERFKKTIEDMGFDSSKVEVNATASYTDSNGKTYERSVVGIEPLSQGYLPEDSSYYSHRNSKETITIEVTIPPKRAFIDTMTSFWTGSKSSLGSYHFKETVMSERW